MSGIDAAKWLRDKGAKSYIIFISAYTEYLPEGYKVEAHRYLLKNDEKLDEAFNECMESAIAKIQMEESRKYYMQKAMFTRLPYMFWMGQGLFANITHTIVWIISKIN